MTATGLSCGLCGTGLTEKAKFCSQCGAAVSAGTKPAEYKQVTVLFADVVHSMDIAAAVGAERLREIMAELVNRSSAVVRRYRGTVDKFTGDGIMAVFGAPVALEDHAIRACLAALDIQQETGQLAQRLSRSDPPSISITHSLRTLAEQPRLAVDYVAWLLNRLTRKEAQQYYERYVGPYFMPGRKVDLDVAQQAIDAVAAELGVAAVAADAVYRPSA